MTAVLEIKGRIQWKSRSWRKHDLTIAVMCLSIDISNWKTTPSFFVELFGVIILESILMLQFGLLKCFGLKRRYSVLIRFIQQELSSWWKWFATSAAAAHYSATTAHYCSLLLTTQPFPYFSRLRHSCSRIRSPCLNALK